MVRSPESSRFAIRRASALSHFRPPAPVRESQCELTFQCHPHWPPILGRRFHSHISHAVLTEKCNQFVQSKSCCAEDPGGLAFARLIALQDHYHHRLLVDIQSRHTPVT